MPKNLVLNSGLRRHTSLAETPDGARNGGLLKHPRVMLKDQDTDCADSDDDVDKNHRSLLAGGESRDKRMKRKRSVGPMCPRPVGEGEAKRTMHPKVYMKRKRLHNLEENDVPSPSPETNKGKAFRAPRSSNAAMSSVAKALPMSGSLGSCQLLHSLNIINQFGGQKPPKKPRTRRSNRVSRVSNHDESQIPTEGFKSDNAALTKRFRSVINGSDSNRSLPLEKLLVRKDFPCTGKDDDDREDIIAAANLAKSHKVLASKDGIWRKAEPLFASISPEKKSYLLQQREEAEELQQRLSLPDTPSGKRFKNSQSKTESGSKEVNTIIQRLLAAIIKEDDIKDYDENECDGDANGMELDHNNGLVDGPCQTSNSTSRQTNFMGLSVDGPYDQLPIETKLLLELHSIGLYPETVPDLHDKEDELNEEIIRLESQLHQQAGKKKEHLNKIHDALQKEKDVEEQNMKQVAMDKLVEIAYEKLSSTGNCASKRGSTNSAKEVALGFAKRTVDRCKKFEEYGVGCFNEPQYRDIINAPSPNVEEADPLIGSAGLGIFIDSSAPTNNADAKGDASELPAVSKSGPILRKANGGACDRSVSNSSLKWNVMRREEDNERNTPRRRGRPPLGNNKRGVRSKPQSKSKPKQKAAHNVKFSSGGGGSGIAPLDSSKEMKEPPGHVSNKVIESIDDLDAEVSINGEGGDLTSWLSGVNLLDDYEPIDGLAIPDDDIFEVFGEFVS